MGCSRTQNVALRVGGPNERHMLQALILGGMGLPQGLHGPLQRLHELPHKLQMMQQPVPQCFGGMNCSRDCMIPQSVPEHAQGAHAHSRALTLNEARLSP